MRQHFELECENGGKRDWRGSQMDREMQHERRVCHQRTSISPMIMALLLGDMVKSWKVRNLAWSLDDFVLAAICYADDVVLAAAIALRSAQANKCLAKWRNRVGFIMAPEDNAREHREIDTVAGFSVELERVDDGESSKRQHL